MYLCLMSLENVVSLDINTNQLKFHVVIMMNLDWTTTQATLFHSLRITAIQMNSN